MEGDEELREWWRKHWSTRDGKWAVESSLHTVSTHLEQLSEIDECNPFPPLSSLPLCFLVAMSRSTSPVQTGETTPLLSTTADSEMSVPSAASSSVPSILATSFRSPQGLLAQLGLAVSTLTLWKVLYTRPAGVRPLPRPLLAFSRSPNILPYLNIAYLYTLYRVLRLALSSLNVAPFRPTFNRWRCADLHLPPLPAIPFHPPLLRGRPPPPASSFQLDRKAQGSPAPPDLPARLPCFDFGRVDCDLLQQSDSWREALHFVARQVWISGTSPHLLSHALSVLTRSASLTIPSFLHFVRLSLQTVSLIIVQIIFGALVVYVPSLFGGENRAKSLWKHHRFVHFFLSASSSAFLFPPSPSSPFQPARRVLTLTSYSISGYVTLTLLIITPALALWSDWLVGNSSKVERYLIGAGLVGALIGVLSRVQYVYLQFLSLPFPHCSVPFVLTSSVPLTGSASWASSATDAPRCAQEGSRRSTRVVVLCSDCTDFISSLLAVRFTHEREDAFLQLRGTAAKPKVYTDVHF